MNRKFRPAHTLSLTALAAACTLSFGAARAAQDDAAPQNRPAKPKPDAAANAALPVTLALDKAEYKRGDTLKFTVTVKNASDEEQKLDFTSGQSFDIVARRVGKDGAPEDAVAWRWADGKIFTRALRSLRLRPSEELSFTATWDQSVRDLTGTGAPGLLAPRGAYILSAEIASTQSLPAAPITITLAN